VIDKRLFLWERATNGLVRIGATDIVAVARGVGIESSEWVRDEAHFGKLLDRRFNDGGLTLLAVKIDDKPGPVQTPRDPTAIRASFMKGLGTGRGGALEGKAIDCGATRRHIKGKIEP
jgi:hypothetical protein